MNSKLAVKSYKLQCGHEFNLNIYLQIYLNWWWITTERNLFIKFCKTFYLKIIINFKLRPTSHLDNNYNETISICSVLMDNKIELITSVSCLKTTTILIEMSFILKHYIAPLELFREPIFSFGPNQKSTCIYIIKFIQEITLHAYA